MKYISTRGLSEPQSFCNILLGGLAPDGGLYLPDTYPHITSDELTAWRSLSYAELAFQIFRKLIDDIPPADLEVIVNKTYTAETYRFARDKATAKAITPLRKLDTGLFARTVEWPNLGIQGHGHAVTGQFI